MKYIIWTLALGYLTVCGIDMYNSYKNRGDIGSAAIKWR